MYEIPGGQFSSQIYKFRRGSALIIHTFTRATVLQKCTDAFAPSTVHASSKQAKAASWSPPSSHTIPCFATPARDERVGVHQTVK